MEETTFALVPQNVTAVFEECLGNEGEGDITVDAIVHMVSLNKAKLEEHADIIGRMLMELPTQFRESTSADGGGGWSFLNACMDRHGNQWTGLHLTMSMLFAMGEALGYVSCLLPREVWKALPGGMPYYVVHDLKIRMS